MNEFGPGFTTIPFMTVDAFTDHPFKGNPAAVCFLTRPAREDWMQKVAAEMNLAETAFVTLSESDEGIIGLRWFTPRLEVDLCGHATIAAAHAIWESGRRDIKKPLRFATRSGILTCKWSDLGIELDFPETCAVQCAPPDDLSVALGISHWDYFGKSPFDYLVVVNAAEIVQQLKPNLALLERYPVRGIIVTAQSIDPKFDFLSRFFAPAAGVNEDPVTGSAHCCLMPYWGSRLGKQTLRAFQASERGGYIDLRWETPRVMLHGKAVTVIRGEVISDQVL